ncbi:MAG: amino acid ABC transporter permease [Anaerovibrio sp.]|nr:amino acid ABC transporter permease [Anaerovibrio sp.]
METRIFDFSMIGTALPDLLQYLDITLLVAGSSIAFGSLLGMLLAWAKLDGVRPLYWLAQGYTYIIRCTPSIVLLFIVFYGLPEAADSIFSYDMNDMHRGVFAVIAFTMLFGAYISEVFRAAYMAVPRGQYEAAVCAGLSSMQAFFHIMLPQAALIALPNFGNSVISLLKEGALAYTIGLIDLIGRGNLLISQNFGAYGIEIYLACLLIYWAMALGLEYIFGKAEQYLGKGRGVQAKKRTARSSKALLKRLFSAGKGGEAHET